jgi:hypothetical protein
VRKLLYICEDYVPPVHDGSGVVYLACLQALEERYEIYAVMFGDPARVTSKTNDALNALCKAHLILPAVLKNPVVQLARTLARAFTGQLAAPRLLEEFGRQPIHRQIAEFVRRHEPDALYLHKLSCLVRVGEEVVANFPGVKIVDLHDDPVAREQAERETLDALIRRYPKLGLHHSYARARWRRRLSRFSPRAARRQEIELLSHFDWLYSASEDEAGHYRRYFEHRVVSCPWPISLTLQPIKAAAAPKYSAGFIASEAVFNLDGLMAFVETQLPLVRERDPGFTLALAGGVCEVFSRACPDYAKLGIDLVGPVKDVADFYASVPVVVVPLLRGTGVSLKTLEALAYRVPVVSTPVGVRGISLKTLANRDIEIVELAVFYQALTRRRKPRPSAFGVGGREDLGQYLDHVASMIEAGSQGSPERETVRPPAVGADASRL